MGDQDALARPEFVSQRRLRVGLDLDGSLESLGNSMVELAQALEESSDCDLVRFRTQSPPQAPNERPIRLRRLALPLWRRSRGPSLDSILGDIDVAHVAGVATPPSSTIPLVITVDDLRPLREEHRTHQRIAQLRRSVAHGATIVASSRVASHEVMSVLEVPRNRVVVVSPAVPKVALVHEGTDLVVNVTGQAELFLSVAPVLVAFAARSGTQVVAVTSDDMASKVRSTGLAVTLRPRRDARHALERARVVMHLSDGARFPSFAIAALGAGVPTIARSTGINRELLGGAAELMSSYDDVAGTLDVLWNNEGRRSIMVAAGQSRALDFAPTTAARAYLNLYREVVRGWES